jgi:hypothetical protein
VSADTVDKSAEKKNDADGPRCTSCALVVLVEHVDHEWCWLDTSSVLMLGRVCGFCRRRLSNVVVADLWADGPMRGSA